jgi:hypothetical protein
MTDSNENESGLATCASTIKQLENDLALGDPERLDQHRQIGEQLLAAKKIARRTFGSWCNENFGRRAQWRCTDMTLARRWDELMQARTWAESEGSKLAILFSVDGALELLRAWDLAMGRVRPGHKRTLSKDNGNAEEAGSAGAGQSTAEDQIPESKREVKELREEAAHFRIQLPLDIWLRARSLAGRLNAEDAAAEQELRAIARQYKWLFLDLREALNVESSGRPELSTITSPTIPSPAEAKFADVMAASAPAVKNAGPPTRAPRERIVSRAPSVQKNLAE